MELFRSHKNLATVLFTLFFLVKALHAQSILSSYKTPPALFAFGDSIIDPGNNNFVPSLAKCNFPPYGRDFIHHKATGRFSNGKIPTDMLVSALGIKELLPPYLDPKLKSSDLLTGVSFASGGAGYDPLTSALQNAITMEDQLEYFKEYKVKLEKIVGPERATTIISESTYIVMAGSNDMSTTYFSIRKWKYDVASYAEYMLELASKFILELHNLGAQQIFVAGLPPLGCLPVVRTTYGGAERTCHEEHNQAAVLFNSMLSYELERLSAMDEDLTLMYVDIYSNLLDMINNPYNYGFEVADKGCCGTGMIEVVFLCNEWDATCKDASTYVFWDSFHPTERAYQILVDNIAWNFFPTIWQAPQCPW